MDIKKDVQKQFGKNAQSYVESSIHKDGSDLSLLVHLAGLKGSEKVLDVATGGGHTANAFAPYAWEVTAFDITEEMLKAAEGFISGNGHKNVIFIKGDAEKLPFADESFDIVTCRIAAHHFPDVEAFVSEAFRVLKPNGKFLLDDNIVPEEDELDCFYNAIEKIRDYSHVRAWKKTEWIRMLESAGFIINQLNRFEKSFEFASWCKRMNLPQEEQGRLADIFRGAPKRVKKYFKIGLEGENVTSFRGEAMVVSASKV
ncbi:methyltransferase domain-containing protein [Peribacillus sp. SCS-37]|uniref:class I SAM-dependent methyltransferase n=1 Tax=Paraperibacillus esterisolvens TaxID=3115296 RepID=UPI003905A2DA